MTSAQAMSELVAAGLNVAVQMQASAAAPAGTVIAQTPVGGMRVPYGAAIMLTVAAGPGPTPTPAATR
jgi:beta-lactam-binding protein with PASTA domain